MIIEQPIVEERGASTRVSYSIHRATATDTLWFEVPNHQADFLLPAMEPAAAALLIVAMAAGEAIELAGPLSPRFHYGLLEARNFFALWYPGLSRVAVTPSGFRPDETHRDGVAAFFSGGVDSFFTLKTHHDMAAPNPAHRLTHLLFVEGYDLPVGDRRYQVLAEDYASLAARLGLNLLRLRTNIRDILDPAADWLCTHGCALAASGLLLRGGLGTLLVPSTNRHSREFSPLGSNPVTDPLMGTESFAVIHHGCASSRIEKILAIASMPEAQHHLRVCWKSEAGLGNCGACPKCLKTMMPLALSGHLDRFQVFPALPSWQDLDPAVVLARPAATGMPELSYAEELRRLAQEQASPEATAALDRVLRQAQPQRPWWKRKPLPWSRNENRT